MNQKYIIAVGIILVAGAFYGGMKYGQNSAGSSRQARFAAMGDGAVPGGRAVRGGAMGAGFVSGEVLSKDAQGLTVKLRDGGSRIIFVGTDTSVMKSAPGTQADIAVGTDVMITGTANSDGSITAKTVQIRPLMPSPAASPTK